MYNLGTPNSLWPDWKYLLE